MATITTVTKTFKQYAFCEDIKQHILSFLKPKKMKITDILLLGECFNIPYHQHFFRIVIFRIRMVITKDQLDWELTHRAQVLFALKNAEMFRRCRDGEISQETYHNWTVIFNKYQRLQQGIIGIGADTKRLHLDDIERTASNRIRKAIAAEVDALKAETRKAKRAARAKEKIACDCGCGKTLARSTVSRHKTLRAQGY